ncbi:MAG: hypothetical protein V1886_03255 [archaeon]
MVKKKGGKRCIMLFAIVIALLALALSAFFLINNSKDSAPAECRSDDDCIKVQTTCCPCSMGGKEVCAGKIQAENLTAKNCPADLMCIAMYACQIKSCACIQGNCGAVL